MKSIPEDLSNKITTLLQTPANNADPKMSITVVRAKDTVMDNTYWTTEVIRTKEGLGDLSVAARRLKPYGGPDSLYNIYVDNGVVKTATRAYPDYQKDGWQDQFELGAGTACAICFDGYWELYKNKWQMITSEKPWIFWVDNTNKLWVQYWNDVATKFELAGGVSKVKAIRGWKNVNMPEVDQGVVVSYIKTNGKIYYRNYCWQIAGMFLWEYEEEVTDFSGTYLTHNLFITNDYRMGIIAENSSGEISMVVTSRDWAGMAIAPERFTVRAKAEVVHIPLTYIIGYNLEKFTVLASAEIANLYAGSYNKFKSVAQIGIGDPDERFEENDGLNYGLQIIFTVNYKIIDFDTTGFEILDTNNVKFRCTDYNRIDDNTFIAIFEDFNNAVGNLTLHNLANKNTNEAGYYFDAFSITFEPLSLIPAIVEPPEVEVIWNE